jgi:hypothetical protein
MADACGNAEEQMSPLRRELLNGVFVLVLASLMSAVFTVSGQHQR